MQPDSVTIRTTLKPGDLGAIVHLHGTIYAREYAFDPTFEAYVAGPLAEFALRIPAERERLWIAEHDSRIVGCIAIVTASTDEAQVRWFLLDPAARGIGLGTRLMREAIAFCEEQGYRRVMLWTVAALTAAARLYRAAGFTLAEERPGRRWGVDVIEQRYERQIWSAAM
jgi:GNAT superfamily N-acetyltransferase